MCNVSVVQADSNAPTECKISINNNALYTNNRYVTLDLYGVDANAMQVWISNDGENGTVLDFAYNTTYTITDQNYVVGVNLDSTNSSTGANTDNVLRVENWPLSSVNGTKKIYAVFRDAYGNKTSTTGLTTINISFDLNGISTDNAPSPITTVKNLATYLPSIVSSAVNKSFTGWAATADATLPSYSPNSLSSFTSNTTLYAIGKTIKVGDYLYYTLDSTKKYDLLTATSGADGTQTFNISTKFSNPTQIFKVIQSSSSSISISPMQRNQVFGLTVKGSPPFYNIGTIVSTICSLYATNYSSATSVISDSLMAGVATDADFSSLFAEYEFNGNSYEEPGAEVYDLYVYCSKIGNYSEDFTVRNGYRYSYTVSAYVYPVITLKTSVRFSGVGTISSPYSLILQ